MYCQNCGKALQNDSLFCSSCGHKISQNVNTAQNYGGTLNLKYETSTFRQALIKKVGFAKTIAIIGTILDCIALLASLWVAAIMIPMLVVGKSMPDEFYSYGYHSPYDRLPTNTNSEISIGSIIAVVWFSVIAIVVLITMIILFKKIKQLMQFQNMLQGNYSKQQIKDFGESINVGGLKVLLVLNIISSLFLYTVPITIFPIICVISIINLKKYIKNSVINY